MKKWAKLLFLVRISKEKINKKIAELHATKGKTCLLGRLIFLQKMAEI